MQNLNEEQLYKERIQPKEKQLVKTGFVNGICRKMLCSYLLPIEFGKLEIIDGERVFNFGLQTPNAPVVRIKVNNENFYSSIVLGGSVGAAESYMIGDWDCSSITEMTRLFVLNRHHLDALDNKAFSAIKKNISKGYHAFRKNTVNGSRKNIAAHYDLGNDFFSRMLDKTMSYSSGIFLNEDDALETASIEKIDRICRKLQLTEDDHLLEIGTGWGGLAIHAAQNYGCRVTTVTISKEQYDYAVNRIVLLGLDHKIEVKLQDYREIEGRYDKLVSIEMIEAVGSQFYQTYFATCSRLVKDDGMFLLQAITIDDRYYLEASKTVDFIKKYIFPGCCIPSQEIISKHIAKDTDYQLYHLDDITHDYALTLRHWLINFRNKLQEIQEMGYNESFCRMWEYYLQYCEGGFLERAIGVGQFLYVKQGAKRLKRPPAYE